jgi:hypothetical protein
VPAGWLGQSWPWSVAGHTLGAWSLDEPGRAPGLPFPGVLGMQTPLVWYDSVSVTMGGDAAWCGFGGTLARAVGYGRPAGRVSRGMLDLRSGDFLFDDNGLSIVRSDSLAWLRAEAVSGSRGPVEALGAIGRHLWGASGGWHRKRHSLHLAYAQRGASATLAAAEEQAVNGESGVIEYRHRGDRIEMSLRGERGRDRHESLGSLFPSSREAGVTGAIAEASLVGEGTRAVRLEWTRTRVDRRPPEGFESEEVFHRGAHTLWAAARWERPIGDGLLRIDLGAGRHGALDRNEWAPGVEYRFRAGPLGARAGVERVLAPEWTDLAPGEAAFMQRTWTGVLELEAGAGARHAQAGFLFGRTMDRAVFHRLPLEEEWLRLGARHDPGTFDFGMLTVSGEWGSGRVLFGGQGFALALDRSAISPRVDPGFAAHTFVEWRGSMFGGDLGLRLRAEIEGVGSRESEGGIAELCGDPELMPPRTLPGYATLGASASFTLAGALVTIRMRNLEDRRREQAWIDCATFEEALGPGRELRFAFTLRLSN